MPAALNPKIQGNILKMFWLQNIKKSSYLYSKSDLSEESAKSCWGNQVILKKRPVEESAQMLYFTMQWGHD